jgi:hypothetical protein
MPAFVAHTASWSSIFPNDAIIGPDGNLWVVGNNTNVYKFDTTTFVTTTYTIATASSLSQLATDGTYVYVVDTFGQNQTPATIIWRLTTSGTATTFLTATAGEYCGSMYFDGTYLWVTTRYYLRQINLSGTIVNSYTGPPNLGGGLVNDGAYWYSGDALFGAGFSYAPVGSPSSWTNNATISSPVIFGRTCIAGGKVWCGNNSANFYSITPGTFAVTTYTPTLSSPGGTGQITFDGTSLWVAYNSPTAGGVWAATPAAPTTGTYWGLGIAGGSITIIYDVPTSVIWGTGLNSAFVGYAYSNPKPSGMRIAMSP